jgi:uncharacterized protein
VNRSAGSIRAGRFDAFDLAARGESIAGVVDVARRPRLADRLAAMMASVPIAWEVVGGHDALARPMLTVAIEGNLPLVCQRCLQPFDWALAQRSELLLAREETELEQLDAGEPEVLLAASLLDPMTVVEDEILLALPFVPRHVDGACAASPEPAARSEVAKTEPGTTSPFARLATLKKGTDETLEE